MLCCLATNSMATHHTAPIWKHPRCQEKTKNLSEAFLSDNQQNQKEKVPKIPQIKPKAWLDVGQLKHKSVHELPICWSDQLDGGCRLNSVEPQEKPKQQQGNLQSQFDTAWVAGGQDADKEGEIVQVSANSNLVSTCKCNPSVYAHTCCNCSVICCCICSNCSVICCGTSCNCSVRCCCVFNMCCICCRSSWRWNFALESMCSSSPCGGQRRLPHRL